MDACISGNVEIARMLVKAGARVNAKAHDGMTSLMYAAENANKTLVRMLLRAGARVNARAKDGYTSLMEACTSASWESRSVYYDDSDAIKTVCTLLDAGANVNMKTKGDRCNESETSP